MDPYITAKERNQTDAQTENGHFFEPDADSHLFHLEPETVSDIYLKGVYGRSES